jgi:hypothetical protein
MFHNFWSELLEMSGVPRVDNIGFRLQSTFSEKRIMNGAADVPTARRRLDCTIILSGIQLNRVHPLSNVVKKSKT